MAEYIIRAAVTLAVLTFLTNSPLVVASESFTQETISIDTPISSQKTYTGKKISLEFQNTDIRDILRIIGEASGKNMVIPDDLRGRVTLKLIDMPWDQALDAVAASRSLVVEQSGNVLMIYDQSTYQRIQSNR